VSVAALDWRNRTASRPRIADTERQAQELASQVRAAAQADVRAAEAGRDQAREQAERYRQDAQQAEQRAAAADARAEDARAETTPAREDAARELEQMRAELAQVRADAAREREEQRRDLESRAQVLEESRTELRARAERDLDAVRAETAGLREETGMTDVAAPARRRTGRASEGSSRCDTGARGRYADLLRGWPAAGGKLSRAAWSPLPTRSQCPPAGADRSRVMGDALQRVDAPTRTSSPVGAELLDGLGAAVGHLPLLGQLVGAPLPLAGPLRVTPQQAEIQGSDDQRARSHQARAQRQQPTPRVIERCLVQRTRGRADVVVGEPVRQRDEQRPHDRQRQDDNGDSVRTFLAASPSTTNRCSRSRNSASDSTRGADGLGGAGGGSSSSTMNAACATNGTQCGESTRDSHPGDVIRFTRPVKIAPPAPMPSARMALHRSSWPRAQAWNARATH